MARLEFRIGICDKVQIEALKMNKKHHENAHMHAYIVNIRNQTTYRNRDRL